MDARSEQRKGCRLVYIFIYGHVNIYIYIYIRFYISIYIFMCMYIYIVMCIKFEGVGVT